MNTDNLVRDLPLTPEIIKIEKQGVLKRGTSSRDKIRHRKKPMEEGTPSKKTTGFGHNSITMVLQSDGGDGSLPRKEITVKIFQNGVFHITGVLDEKYDRDVVNKITTHISATCPHGIVSGEWDMTQRRVVLMNYRTKILGIDNVSREALYTGMNARGVRCCYEPAVYPAVKIYFPDKRWIAKVFRTGQVILTGMTSAPECSALMTDLQRVLLPLTEAGVKNNNNASS